MRGEIPISGSGFHGLRRREREDVATVLGSLVTLHRPYVVIGDAAKITQALPSGFTLRGLQPDKTLYLQGPHAELVVKLIPPLAHFPKVWRGRFLSGARKAHYFAHRLSALAVPTQRILGFAEAVRRPRHNFSWLVLQPLDGTTLAAQYQHTQPHHRKTLQVVAQTLATLHRHKLAYITLSAQQIILQSGQASMIDLEHIAPRWNRNAPLHNLQQLVESLGPKKISIYDAMRFLRYYIGPAVNASQQRITLIDSIHQHLTSPPT